MKIIILGAGHIGRILAENLIKENNDITIVDNDHKKLRLLQNKFDLLTIQGYCSYPETLKKAGAETADMLIAVTNSDEINIISCQIAYILFKTPNRIACIRSYEYINKKKLIFSKNKIPINHLISPEKLITDDLYKFIKYPGVLQIFNFAKNKASLIIIKIKNDSVIINNDIIFFKNKLSNINLYLITIFRKNKFIIIENKTIIKKNDKIFLLTETKYINLIINKIQQKEKPYKKIMIVGSNNININLALKLEKNHSIKLIEKNKKKASKIANKLNNTIVLHGNASDQELLNQENIEQINIFIATTKKDETNIMLAMLAKQMGAKKVLALVKKKAYRKLIKNTIIDIIISPQQIIISSLIKYTKKLNINNIYLLKYNSAEILEITVNNKEENSKIIGKKISDIILPKNIIICSIIRKNKILINIKDIFIEKEDHIIVFINDKKYIKYIEELFKPVKNYINI